MAARRQELPKVSTGRDVRSPVSATTRGRWATRLRAARVRADLSQTQLGALVGCSHQAVSAWECERAVPSPEARMRIAHVLKRDVDELFPTRSRKRAAA